MKKILLAMFFFSCAAVIRANLGETPAQIYKRYGPVQQRGEGSGFWEGHYIAGFWCMIVRFRDGKSVMESAQQCWTRPLNDATELALMDEISGSTNWVVSKKDWLDGTVWTNADNGDVAVLPESIGLGDFPGKPILFVWSAAEYRR